jgi:hypothetical protein
VIRGFFTGGWPYVVGRISFPRLKLGPTTVRFMLDTGSDATMLHPGDAYRLGVDFDAHFQGIQPDDILGVGAAEAYLEEVTIELPHVNGTVDRFAGDIFVAIPTDINGEHPSVLGRDVFDHYCILYSMTKNILLLR